MENTQAAAPIMRPSDYQNAIEDQVKLSRHYLHLKQHPEHVREQIADLRNRAALATAAADRLQSELDEAPDLYIRCTNEIARLREGLVLTKQANAITTISKLADQLKELDPAALAAVMAQLEQKANGGAK